MLEYCAGDPIERVFLEDAARRGHSRFRGVLGDDGLDGLCYFGANVVPSGQGCWEFAGEAANRATRMIIGQEAAVSELWSAAQLVMPSPREDRPGQPVYVLDQAPAPGSSGLRAATLHDLDLLVPACALTHRGGARRRPAAARSGRASGAGPPPRSRRAARGSGSRTARSCSRPKRRRGRRAQSSSSRSGSTRRRGGWATPPGGSATSAGSSSTARRWSASSCGPRTAPALRSVREDRHAPGRHVPQRSFLSY